jgi:hypothetical protein
MKILLTQDCFLKDEAVVWRWVGLKLVSLLSVITASLTSGGELKH